MSGDKKFSRIFLTLFAVIQRSNAIFDAFSEFRHKAAVDDWVADVVDEEEIAKPALLFEDDRETQGQKRCQNELQ